MNDLILVKEPTKHVLLLELSRPEAANSLTSELAKRLTDIFKNTPTSIRCVVLAGRGKHFCAGADLKERRSMDEAAWKAQHALFRAARDAVLECDVPVIAAVHGAAMGGGFELALASDFIYAAEDARFALTEARLGIMPGMGGTQLLPRRIGLARARELLFTGAILSAQEALNLGIINRMSLPEQLLEDALATASAIAANAPLSVRALKKALKDGMEQPLEAALKIELSHYDTLLSTHDRHEGIAAWNDKRKPVFTGK